MSVTATQTLSPQMSHKWVANEGPSVASVEGFKDAMLTQGTLNGMFNLDGSNPITEQQAMKAATDMMEAFYSQTFKALFEGMNKSEEDNEFATGMTKDIFVEQLAKTMSRHVTSQHQKIASMLMKENQQRDVKKEIENDLESVSLEQTFDEVAREVFDVRV